MIIIKAEEVIFYKFDNNPTTWFTINDIFARTYFCHETIVRSLNSLKKKGSIISEKVPNNKKENRYRKAGKTEYD